MSQKVRDVPLLVSYTVALLTASPGDRITVCASICTEYGSDSRTEARRPP